MRKYKFDGVNFGVFNVYLIWFFGLANVIIKMIMCTKFDPNYRQYHLVYSSCQNFTVETDFSLQIIAKTPYFCTK